MKTILMLASVVAIGGCSVESSQKAPVNLNNQVSSESEKYNAIAPLANVPQQEPSDKAITKQKLNRVKPNQQLSVQQGKSSSYSLAINQQKFTSSSPIVKAGQSLFNVQMQNLGVVKSSFVVISDRQPQWLSSDFSINEIAKQTFRLQSKSLDANLYQWYKRLAQDKRFSTVELEIDYSGKAYVPEF
ncbi:hypothetical protein [Shewanella aestuarii]|uniref:Lipoprotein n=1 Tax=Shewanella aestuarii TaxID=1028752 RepID=A0A6G9QPE5_9GAMM|nr:hypothetical protein [Shewanella aestuarii]QIR15691.1 hypothetical protein HBH39_15350 [Shewanella aestuarii]